MVRIIDEAGAAGQDQARPAVACAHAAGPLSRTRPSGLDGPAQKCNYIFMSLTAALADVCVTFHLRRAARAASHRLDAALAPLGLTAGQFTILGALAAETDAEGANAARLGRRLAMDRSTLNRNMAPLTQAGWVVVSGGRGRGGLRYRLSADGEDLLVAAVGPWQAQQKDLIAAVGGAEAARFLAALDRVTATAGR